MTTSRRHRTPIGTQRWRVRKDRERGKWLAAPISDGSFGSILSAGFRARLYATHAEALAYANRSAKADGGWVVAA